MVIFLACSIISIKKNGRYLNGIQSTDHLMPGIQILTFEYRTYLEVFWLLLLNNFDLKLLHLDVTNSVDSITNSVDSIAPQGRTPP